MPTMRGEGCVATLAVQAMQPRTAWATPVEFSQSPPASRKSSKEAASSLRCNSADTGHASSQLLNAKEMHRRNSWDLQDKMLWGKLRALTYAIDNSCPSSASQKENAGNRHIPRSASHRNRASNSSVAGAPCLSAALNAQKSKTQMTQSGKRRSLHRSAPALQRMPVSDPTRSEAADCLDHARSSSKETVQYASEDSFIQEHALEQPSLRPLSASLPCLHDTSNSAKDAPRTLASPSSFLSASQPILPTAIRRLTQEAGSNSQRRASRPQSCNLSRVKIRQETTRKDDEDRFLLQFTALEALLEQLSMNKPMEIVASSMLNKLLTRESSPVFSPGLVSRVVQQVLVGRGLAVAEAAVAIGRLLSSLPEVSNQNRAVLLLQMLQILKPLAAADACGLLGQILWQHRYVECLQQKPHREIVEDLSWITFPDDAAGFLGSIEKVFQDLTIVGGGRMDFRQWQKAVQILQKCPELEAQVPRQEANRLYYACGRYNSQANRTIGSKEFVKLLLEFASAGRVHPFLVFRTIHSHAGRGAYTRQPL